MEKSHIKYLNHTENIGGVRVKIESFFTNKLNAFSLWIFIIIFISVLVLPLFIKTNIYYMDNSQQNIAPGHNIMNVPKELEKNGVIDIGVGSTFSVGVDRNYRVYTWGKYPNIKLEEIPKEVLNAKIKVVSAGYDHILAIDIEGNLYTWGNSRMNLGEIPHELSNKKVSKVYAGHQISIAITDAEELYIWGNRGITEDINIPTNLQGNFKDITICGDNIIALLTDGTLYPVLIRSNAILSIPHGTGKISEISSTDNIMAAILETGELILWGNDANKDFISPKEIFNNAVKLYSGSHHFTAITKDTKIVSFGENTYGQTEIPKSIIGKEIENIYSGYYQNYAVDTDGKLYKWGLSGYLFGTDEYGRDIFSRLIIGGRLSLLAGGIALIIYTILGVMIGSVAGFYGGLYDVILMRFTEIVDSIPFIPLAMTLSVLIANKFSESIRIVIIMIILGLLSWGQLARLVRGEILAEKEKGYVKSAIALGITNKNIILRHIMPSIAYVIIINCTLSYGAFLLAEAALSFLGFGVLEPNPSWGNMLTGVQSTAVLKNYWWRWLYPILALMLTTVSITLIGEGIKDGVDPRNK